MEEYYTDERVRDCLHGRTVGGGEGYRSEIRLSDADVVVDDRSSFFDALEGSAEVVGIAPHARIDLSGRDFTLRKTLVSDRGVDGSPGGLLYTTDHGDSSPAWDGGSSGRGVITMRGGARLVGLRFRGPYHDHYDDPRYPGYIPLDDGDADERRRQRQERYARGVRIMSDDAEVDNCELWGFPVQAISIGSSSTPVSPSIGHVHIHNCMMVGFGYAIDVVRGHPTIQASYFNATRHSVNGFGHPDCGYTLTDSVFGPITYSHAVDMHSLAENSGSSDDLTAGGRVEVRRCTFAFTHNIDGRWAQAIAFRGYPDDGYVTERNRFLHRIDGSEPVENVANSGNEPVPYRQVNVGSGWHDWEFVDNSYGPGAPRESHVGAPVNLDAPNEGRPLIGEERRRGYLSGLDPVRE
jgi:hypothetical protein